MEEVGIKVIYESEVAKALKNTQDFEKTLAGLGNQAVQTAKQFGGISDAIDKTGKASQKLVKPVGNAAGAMTGLTRIVQDAPFGFIAIGNNISETLSQFQSLSQQAGGAGNALKALGASFIGSGGVILGLNLAITGITTLVQKYGSLGAAIDAILNPLSQQARIQKEINSTMLKGAQDAQTELARLDALYRAATNVNVPLSERNKIVDELQKKYPSYLGNLSNEQILAGKGAAAYQKLRDAVIAAARAKAIQNKIADLSSEQLENDIKREKALDNLIKAQKLEEKIGVAAAVGHAAAELENYRKRGEEIVATIDELVKRQDALVVSTGAVAAGLDFGGKGETEKKVKTISSVLKDLEKDLTAIDVQFAAIGGNVRNLPIDKIKAFEKAVGELSDLSVRPGDKIFDQIQERIRQLQATLTHTPVTLKIPIVIEPLPKVGFNHEAFRAAIQNFDFSSDLKTLQNNINAQIQNFLLDGIVNIGDGVGSALVGSSSGIKDAMKSFLTLLGNYMQNVGKQLIIYSGVLKGIQVSIATLNFTVAAVAGAAAIVAGGALKAYASQLPSFATGGIVNGVTVAKIGDNPGRREAIVPSEDWREAFGGGLGNGFIAETRLRGQDLYILVKKAAVQQGRVN